MLRASRKCLTTLCSKQVQALRASYYIAHHIAKAKKPHTIAEELLLAAAMDLVREVLDKSAADKLKLIPLSNDAISRRIEETSDDIKRQTTASIQASTALQIYESTDIANNATLLVYVRHVGRGLAGEISPLQWQKTFLTLWICTWVLHA